MFEQLQTEYKNIGQQLASEQLAAFVYNDGLSQMASLFGAPELPGDMSERLTVLKQVADIHWDFRRGAERQSLDWENQVISCVNPSQWNLLFEGATMLGMTVSSSPENRSPDYLNILGGAGRVPLERLQYGLKSVDDFGFVVFLGSSRALTDAERLNTVDYAPKALTEYDLGCSAFMTAVDGRLVSSDKEVHGDDVWEWSRFTFDYGGQSKTGIVINTPQQINGFRATTHDNYSSFAAMAGLQNNSDVSVVAVSTGCHVPAQHLTAVHEITARFGARVETIGHAPELTRVNHNPAQLLQETKAAIDAADRLNRALEAASS